MPIPYDIADIQNILMINVNGEPFLHFANRTSGIVSESGVNTGKTKKYLKQFNDGKVHVEQDKGCFVFSSSGMSN